MLRLYKAQIQICILVESDIDFQTVSKSWSISTATDAALGDVRQASASIIRRPLGSPGVWDQWEPPYTRHQCTMQVLHTLDNNAQCTIHNRFQFTMHNRFQCTMHSTQFTVPHVTIKEKGKPRASAVWAGVCPSTGRGVGGLGGEAQTPEHPTQSC